MQDFTSSELVRLHTEKEKERRRDESLRSKAWGLIMAASQIHLRDVVIPFQGPPPNPSGAFNAVKDYYEGRTEADKKDQLDLLMQSIPQLLKDNEKPSLDEVTAVITAIDSVTAKFLSLHPPVDVPDHTKKSIFQRSLPKL